MLIQAAGGTPLFLRGQAINGATVRLGTLDWGDRVLDCTLTDCRIELVRPPSVHLSRCRFIRCFFSSKKKVSLDILFCANFWDGCKFSGRYEGTQFGLWDEAGRGPCPWGDVALRGCDFRPAILAGCTFWRLDAESTQFPPWPCFTLLEPAANQAEWKANVPPSLADMFVGDDPEDVSALSFHWPTVVKWYKHRAFPDAEVVRTTLQPLSFIRL